MREPLKMRPGGLEDILAQLDPQERQVIDLAFGLVDGYPQSDQEVALTLDMPEETVASLSESALSKLRQIPLLPVVEVRTPEQIEATNRAAEELLVAIFGNSASEDHKQT